MPEYIFGANARIFALLIIGLVAMGTMACAHAAEGGADLRLAEDGQALCRIVTPEDAGELDRAAATELADCIEEITGARPAITTQPGEDATNIYVGHFPRCNAQP